MKTIQVNHLKNKDIQEKENKYIISYIYNIKPL
jgi:hypothetical protein